MYVKFKIISRLYFIAGCRFIVLPEIRNKKIRDHLYYSIDTSCLHLEACFGVSVNIGGTQYHKSLKAFVDIDYCKFLCTIGFEGWRETIVLISYEWGMLIQLINLDISQKQKIPHCQNNSKI